MAEVSSRSGGRDSRVMKITKTADLILTKKPNTTKNPQKTTQHNHKQTRINSQYKQKPYTTNHRAPAYISRGLAPC